MFLFALAFGLALALFGCKRGKVLPQGVFIYGSNLSFLKSYIAYEVDPSSPGRVFQSAKNPPYPYEGNCDPRPLSEAAT